MMEVKPRKLRKAAKQKLAEADYLFKRSKSALAADTIEEIKTSLEKTRASLKDRNWDALSADLEDLEKHVEAHLSHFQPNRYWETIKALVFAVSIALFIRWLLIEPFRIPSGSMIPTLLIGDQLMVNKLVYGPNIPFTTRKLFMPRKPKRGEVVVFKYPHDIHEDFIKRVVGVPGDEILLADGNLYINGDKVEKVLDKTVHSGQEGCSWYQGCDLFTEQLGDVNHNIYLYHRSHRGEAYRSGRVPDEHLFVMGDNRDNSNDSRGWGFVPYSHLKGKAMFIHLPLDPERHYMPRWKRFFKWIR